MKKTKYILLIVFMSFLLVGCGRSEKIKDADEEVKVNANLDIIQYSSVLIKGCLE